MTTHKSLN
uniref:Uncharacterized protein n=1 Tax=Rhizophora mucronata TaxID=61149 RepID=A0A2P2NEP0_RHIMU